MGMSTQTKISLVVGLIIILCTLFSGVALGNYLGQLQSKAAYESLLQSYRVQHEHISVVNNKIQTTEKALVALTDEHTDTLSLLAKLKAVPSEVKYITRVETKLVPTDPVYISQILPREYTYKSGPLITGKFSSAEDYKFTTYELSFRTTLLTTKNKTAVLVQGSSSADPDKYYDLPSEVIVSRQSDHKVLAPQLALGITAGGPSWDLGGSVIMPWLHPVETLDVLSPRLTVSSKQVRIGVDAVSYNVGKPLPIVDDLWISLGGSTNLQAKPNLDLSISTKF